MKLMRFSCLLAVLCLFTGCATSGRHVLLREYSPTIPPQANSPLAGKSILVKPFSESFHINNNLEEYPTHKKLAEPVKFIFQKMPEADVKAWDLETDALRKAKNEGQWKEIGYVRNGFGAVLSKVHALSPPGPWLTDTLRNDLRQLGAKVADGADADIEIEGTIRYLKIDIYMKYWADLIVDVQVKVKGKPTIARQIHTSGAQTAWSSSSFEFFQPLRQCQQKMTQTLLTEIENALRN